MTKKITKKEKFQEAINFIEGNEVTGKVTAEELVEFFRAEIAALDRKAEKAKERAAEKKAEEDPMVEQVYEALTDEPQLIADIVEAMGNEEATAGKVAYRLNALVKEGRAAKDYISEKGRKLVTYKRA